MKKNRTLKKVFRYGQATYGDTYSRTINQPVNITGNRHRISIHQHGDKPVTVTVIGNLPETAKPLQCEEPVVKTSKKRLNFCLKVAAAACFIGLIIKTSINNK